MLPALLTTLLWSYCLIPARQSVAQIGENAANTWRLLVAVLVMGVIASWGGLRLGQECFAWFLLSGVIGFGLGDLGVFFALPRIGSRLTLLMAQCLYYGAVPLASAYSWNPQGRVRHHYDLVSDMNEALGHDFLFISGAPDVLAMKDCFASTVALSPIEVPTHLDRTLHFFVYRLNGFRGYQWCD